MILDDLTQVSGFASGVHGVACIAPCVVLLKLYNVVCMCAGGAGFAAGCADEG